MKQIGIILKDGTVKVIGIPDLATDREPTSDEKIILELSEKIENMQTALESICNAALPPVSFDRERILRICKEQLNT